MEFEEGHLKMVFCEINDQMVVIYQECGIKLKKKGK